MSDPILPLAVWEEGTLQNDVPANDNSLRIEAMRRPVEAIASSPSVTDDGTVYIVGAAPSGAFSSFDPDDLTIYRGGTWYAWAPTEGLEVNGYQFTGSGGWVAGVGGGAVSSVNGQTGAVSLALDDLTDVSAAAPTTTYVLTWDGSEWVPAAPSGGMSNPMTTAGDIITGGSSGTPQRLAAGTNGYVLTMVSGSPAWAAAGGGGGLTNWTDALNSSSPNATIPVASLAATNAATNVDAAIVPKGDGALLISIPDGTTTGGNKRGTRAIDLQVLRGAATHVASGNYSVISGGSSNAATGSSSVVSGGLGNEAAGGYSTVSGGTLNNTGTSGYGAIGGGQSNTIGNSGGNNTIAGGASNSISASVNWATVAGGQGNDASADYSSVTGGNANAANGEASRAGGRQSDCRSQIGVDAFSAGQFATKGDSQVRRHHLRSDTTNATPEAITANNGAAGATNQVALPNNSAYNFDGKVVVRENATGDCASYKFEGTIRRGANAAATALVAAVTPVVVSADAGAATWTVAVTADTTNGALAITVTGEASHNLKWTGFVETVEVVG